jgi:excisionase family DNA binding protein
MAARKRTADHPPRLIGAKHVPPEFGIKYTSLRHLAHSGRIPFLRIGRAMYFERTDIEQWIASQKERRAS